jgi:hypothetical protein
MRTDFDAMPFRKADGRAHVVEIGSVEATRDVSNGDARHDRGIISHLVEPEASPMSQLMTVIGFTPY